MRAEERVGEKRWRVLEGGKTSVARLWSCWYGPLRRGRSCERGRATGRRRASFSPSLTSLALLRLLFFLSDTDQSTRKRSVKPLQPQGGAVTSKRRSNSEKPSHESFSFAPCTQHGRSKLSRLSATYQRAPETGCSGSPALSAPSTASTPFLQHRGKVSYVFDTRGRSELVCRPPDERAASSKTTGTRTAPPPLVLPAPLPSRLNESEVPEKINRGV
jgi:hypothetical protein